MIEGHICDAILRDQSEVSSIDYESSQKKKLISIVFYCSENPSIAHNLGTTGPIQVGFSAKCISPNGHFNQKEN